jgi:hypothetical protein
MAKLKVRTTRKPKPKVRTTRKLKPKVRATRRLVRKNPPFEAEKRFYTAYAEARQLAVEVVRILHRIEGKLDKVLQGAER